MKRIPWKQSARLMLLAIGAGVCTFADESFAQIQGPHLVPQPRHAYMNVARLNVGVGFYDSGWYTCNYFYPNYACTSGSYSSYIPFVLGVQTDIHLAGSSYLSPGIHAMTGSISASYFNGVTEISNSTHITLWEPTLDYVGKIGSPYEEILGRFRVGGALYFGSDGNFGGGFRIGGGGSFFNNQRIGLGLEIVFEGGSYNGYWLGGVQLLASPEFHF